MVSQETNRQPAIHTNIRGNSRGYLTRRPTPRGIGAAQSQEDIIDLVPHRRETDSSPLFAAITPQPQRGIFDRRPIPQSQMDRHGRYGIRHGEWDPGHGMARLPNEEVRVTRHVYLGPIDVIFVEFTKDRQIWQQHLPALNRWSTRITWNDEFLHLMVEKVLPVVRLSSGIMSFMHHLQSNIGWLKRVIAWNQYKQRLAPLVDRENTITTVLERVLPEVPSLVRIGLNNSLVPKISQYRHRLGTITHLQMNVIRNFLYEEFEGNPGRAAEIADEMSTILHPLFEGNSHVNLAVVPAPGPAPLLEFFPISGQNTSTLVFFGSWVCKWACERILWSLPWYGDRERRFRQPPGQFRGNRPR